MYSYYISIEAFSLLVYDNRFKLQDDDITTVHNWYDSVRGGKTMLYDTTEAYAQCAITEQLTLCVKVSFLV